MRARSALALLAAAALTADAGIRAQSDPPAVGPVLDRIVNHLHHYYARAQSLIGREQATRQPIRADYSFDGTPTRYDFQLRLEWAPSDDGDIPKAMMMRELVAVNGRAPKPKDKPQCAQPEEVWSEPLTMFLPGERDGFEFKWAGTGRVDREAAVMLDFRARSEKRPPKPELQWEQTDNQNCVSFSLPGRQRGRVWVSQDTGEVLRLDEEVSGPIEFPIPRDRQDDWRATSLTFDRGTTSTRYKRVRFEDPEETLMLPASIEEISIVRGAQPQRLTHRFTEYRRFMTGGRLVE